jgi:hypothetical protein
MNPFEQVPDWLLRPLPVNAAVDDELMERIDKLAPKLPKSLGAIENVLQPLRSFREYDAAVNRACAHVWLARESFFGAESPSVRMELLRFASAHMMEHAQARIFRRLVKDSAIRVRQRARHLIEQARFREVALPRQGGERWDASGWLQGAFGGPIGRHPQGRKVRERIGVPQIGTVAQLRKLLDVRSEKQLGYFLLATDAEDGPYTSFTIPKRDGSKRQICAPKPQLRWVQRQILEKVLDPVAVHEAAHGFVTGRSTVTNASHHQGAALILKFDLSDFFPTIHYYRVVGLFTRLGYSVGDARFSASDESANVAPTLARLCCYTPDPHQWGNAVLPQGAPTSPAISNLVCRRLDARLTGLAMRNKGVYTRYADDLTFSFKEPGVKLGRFRWWVDQICHQEGFIVNQAKFRVIRSSQRQVVTGIVVNDALRIPREERRRFRAILHNCQKHGVASQARGHARFAAYLRGYASYINMVQPEEGAELLALVNELLGPEAEQEGGES